MGKAAALLLLILNILGYAGYLSIRGEAVIPQGPQGPGDAPVKRLTLSMQIHSFIQESLAATPGAKWRDKLLRGAESCDIDGDGLDELIVWGLRYIYVIDDTGSAALLTTADIGRPGWFFDKPFVAGRGDKALIVVSASNVYDLQPRLNDRAAPGTGIRHTYTVIVYWRPFENYLEITSVLRDIVVLSRTAVMGDDYIYMAGGDIYIYRYSSYEAVHRIRLYLVVADKAGRVETHLVYSGQKRVSDPYLSTDISTSYYLYLHPAGRTASGYRLLFFASGYTGVWTIHVSGTRIINAEYTGLINDNGEKMLLIGNHRSIHVMGMSNTVWVPLKWKAYTYIEWVIGDVSLIPLGYKYGYSAAAPLGIWDNILPRMERVAGILVAKGLGEEAPAAYERILVGRNLAEGLVVKALSSMIIGGRGDKPVVYMVVYADDGSGAKPYLAAYDPMRDVFINYTYIDESIIHQITLLHMGRNIIAYTPHDILVYSPTLRLLERIEHGRPVSRAGHFSYEPIPLGGHCLRLGGECVIVSQLYDRENDYPTTRYMFVVPRVAGSSLAAISVRTQILRASMELRHRIYGLSRIILSCGACAGAARILVKGIDYSYNASTPWITPSSAETGLSIPARGRARVILEYMEQAAVYRYSGVRRGYIPDIYGGAQRPIWENHVSAASETVYIVGALFDAYIASPPPELYPADYEKGFIAEAAAAPRIPVNVAPPSRLWLEIRRGRPLYKTDMKQVYHNETYTVYMARMRPMEPGNYTLVAGYGGDEVIEPFNASRSLLLHAIVTRIAVNVSGPMVARQPINISVRLLWSRDGETWLPSAAEALYRINHTDASGTTIVVEKGVEAVLSIPEAVAGSHAVAVEAEVEARGYENPAPTRLVFSVKPLRLALIAPATVVVGEDIEVSLHEQAPGHDAPSPYPYMLEIRGPGGITWRRYSETPETRVPGEVFSRPGRYHLRALLSANKRLGDPRLYYETLWAEASLDVVDQQASVTLRVEPELGVGGESTYALAPVHVYVGVEPWRGGEIVLWTGEERILLSRPGWVTIEYREPGPKTINATYTDRYGAVAEASTHIMVYPMPVTIETPPPPYRNSTTARIIDALGRPALGWVAVIYRLGSSSIEENTSYSGGELVIDPGRHGLRPAEGMGVARVEIVFRGNTSYAGAWRRIDILVGTRSTAPRPLPEPGTALILYALLLARILVARRRRRDTATR